jgi:hypothetical protein
MVTVEFVAMVQLESTSKLDEISTIKMANSNQLSVCKNNIVLLSLSLTSLLFFSNFS